MVSKTLKNNVELMKFENILLDEMNKIFKENLRNIRRR